MRPDTRLDRAAQRLDQAARHKPHIDREIMRRLGECDQAATNETGISGSGLSDPTSTLAIRRADIMRTSNEIDAAVTAVEAAGHHLLAVMARIRIPDTHVEHPRCTGGDPSTWGDPECGKYVEHYERDDGTIGYRSDMLCSAHRFAKRRHESSGAMEQPATTQTTT